MNVRTLVSASIAILYTSASLGGEPEVWHFGLPHRALGEAQLDLDPNGHLVVSNIGSSGQDGVNIDPGLAECLVVGFQANGPFDTADEIHLASEVFEPIPVAILFDDARSEQRLVPNVEVDDGLLRFAILRNGETVYEGLMLSNEEVRTPVGEDEIGTFIHWCLIDCGDTRYLAKYSRAPMEPQRANFILPDGNEIEGDTVKFSLLNDNGAEMEDSTRLSAASHRDDFKILVVAEMIGQWGNAHSAIGDARMYGGGDHLTISNIGSTGDDGVSLNIRGIPEPDPVGDGSAIDFLVQNLVCEGQYRFYAHGRVDGEGDQPIGGADFECTPDNTWQITPDFSPVGAQTCTVRVLDKCRVIAEISGYAGSIESEMVASEFYILDPRSGLWDCVSYSGRGPIRIGGEEFLGDQVMFGPDDATRSVESIERIDIRMADLEGFVIIGEGGPADLPELEWRYTRIKKGTKLAGGLQEISESDDLYLHAQSEFTGNWRQPHIVDLLLVGEYDGDPAAARSLTAGVESLINEPGGLMYIKLRNWKTGKMDVVLTERVNRNEKLWCARALDASLYVRESDGRVLMTVRHRKLTTFDPAGFQSSFDHVWVRIQE